MDNQYIVICMDDDKRYIQSTRRRFLTSFQAAHYMKAIAKSRKPIIVNVEPVKLDEQNYPIYD
jgi:hypothetical protein